MLHKVLLAKQETVAQKPKVNLSLVEPAVLIG